MNKKLKCLVIMSIITIVIIGVLTLFIYSDLDTDDKPKTNIMSDKKEVEIVSIRILEENPKFNSNNQIWSIYQIERRDTRRENPSFSIAQEQEEQQEEEIEEEVEETQEEELVEETVEEEELIEEEEVVEETEEVIEETVVEEEEETVIEEEVEEEVIEETVIEEEVEEQEEETVIEEEVEEEVIEETQEEEVVEEQQEELEEEQEEEEVEEIDIHKLWSLQVASEIYLENLAEINFHKQEIEKIENDTTLTFREKRLLWGRHYGLISGYQRSIRINLKSYNVTVKEVRQYLNLTTS